MKERYSRNIGTLTEQEQLKLASKKVCVIGCGGLGGFVIESLSRIGVGRLTVVDGDVFDVSNLNRQRLSAEDNIETRFLLAKTCERENIPLVHGAIAGWCGQVAICMPGDGLMNKIYADTAVGAEKDMGNPAFTPAIIANLQVAETIKLLLGRENVLKGRLLIADILNHEYEIIEFGE